VLKFLKKKKKKLLFKLKKIKSNFKKFSSKKLKLNCIKKFKKLLIRKIKIKTKIEKYKESERKVSILRFKSMLFKDKKIRKLIKKELKRLNIIKLKSDSKYVIKKLNFFIKLLNSMLLCKFKYKKNKSLYKNFKSKSKKLKTHKLKLIKKQNRTKSKFIYKHNYKVLNKKNLFFKTYKSVFLNRLVNIICPKVSYHAFSQKTVISKLPNLNRSSYKDKAKICGLVSFWIKKAIVNRKEKTFILKFYSELLDINLKKGETYKQKIEYYKILYQNKKFYKFKKWI